MIAPEQSIKSLRTDGKTWLMWRWSGGEAAHTVPKEELHFCAALLSCTLYAANILLLLALYDSDSYITCRKKAREGPFALHTEMILSSKLLLLLLKQEVDLEKPSSFFAHTHASTQAPLVRRALSGSIVPWLCLKLPATMLE